MNHLKVIFKCKLLGQHAIEYQEGYGYRCVCCKRTVKEINKGVR